MSAITNIIDFGKVEIRDYDLDKLQRDVKKRVRGLDTETLNGYCRLIADNRGNYALAESADDCLDFLMARRFRSTHNFFFNLNYDVNSIIKYLDREQLTQLYEANKTLHNGIKIFYIPKKILRLSKGHHVNKFYDVAQFFNGSLEFNAKNYLGLNKYIDPIDRATLGTSADYWRDNLPAIIRYCVNDCMLTMKLGRLLDSTISSALDSRPPSYVSKASVCKDYVRKVVKIPPIKDIPLNALKYAFNAYSGGRFEIIKKGFVENCHLYDINSAYPYHIQNLLDISCGNWRYTKSLNESASYGFYLVEVMTHYNKITPLHFMLKNRVITYPILDATMYLTKDELLAYEKYIDFKILGGWEFYPKREKYPFKDYVDKFWQLKSSADKSDYQYSLYKIMINSLYGAFYEKIQDGDKWLTGKLFNPIYATMITAKTRIQLFEAAMIAPNQVVGFATDSVLFKGDIDFETNKDLGGWSLEASGDALILRGGVYQIADKLKNRGIKKVGRLETPYGYFHDIFDYIRQRPFETVYPIITNRPLNFAEVILHHKTHAIEDINVFHDMTYNLDINRDWKREWHSNFSCGQELFEKSIDSEALLIEA